jgi:hypothetical protein
MSVYHQLHIVTDFTEPAEALRLLHDVPEDVKLNILALLDQGSLGRLAETEKEFREIVNATPGRLERLRVVQLRHRKQRERHRLRLVLIFIHRHLLSWLALFLMAMVFLVAALRMDGRNMSPWLAVAPQIVLFLAVVAGTLTAYWGYRSRHQDVSETVNGVPWPERSMWTAQWDMLANTPLGSCIENSFLLGSGERPHYLFCFIGLVFVVGMGFMGPSLWSPTKELYGAVSSTLLFVGCFCVAMLCPRWTFPHTMPNWMKPLGKILLFAVPVQLGLCVVIPQCAGMASVGLFLFFSIHAINLYTAVAILRTFCSGSRADGQTVYSDACLGRCGRCKCFVSDLPMQPATLPGWTRKQTTHTSLCALLMVLLFALAQTVLCVHYGLFASVGEFNVFTVDEPLNFSLLLAPSPQGYYPALPGSFGADIPNSGLQGNLSLAHPFSGCEPSFTSLSGSIAVMWRSEGCHFTVMAQNAQNAGAIAVLVVWDDADIAPMGGTDENITIPVLGIIQEMGEVLAGYLTRGLTIPPSPPSPARAPINTTDVQLTVTVSNAVIIWPSLEDTAVFTNLTAILPLAFFLMVLGLWFLLE